ncbi:MAG: hypothetical protein ABIH92_01285 [Nanoarchaeota archaeon]
MYTDIEIICSGNNDRSPVAKASGIKLVKLLGLQDTVNISSSGTMVDLSQISDLTGLLMPHVEKSVRIGFLTPDYIQRAREDPLAVADEMLTKGENWRNRYIMESMGLDFSGHQRRQTVLRPEAKLILPVAGDVLEKVNEIYKGATGVRIELLPAFAGLPYNLSGEDDAIVNYQGYKRLMAKVETVTRAAMVKALEL